MTVLPDFPELRTADRCDRCNAQAFVITLHINGLLYWCKHHYEQNEAELASSGDRLKALAIDDHRDRLNAKASISASAV